MNKLLGEKDVEAVLQRLDRLTLDEARATAAQSLEAVYGLIQNMRILIGGEQLYGAHYSPTAEYRSFQVARH